MKLTICLLLGCVLSLGAPGNGAEPGKPCPLRTVVFKIPPGYLGDAPPAPPVARPLTAMDYLQAAGIEFPPGGDATFAPASSTLTVRATNEVIEKIRLLVESNPPPPRQVRVILGLAEFTLPDAEALPGLTYDRARALAGDSWRMIERTSALAKAGQKTTCRYPGGKNEPAPPSTSTRKARPSAAPELAAERTEYLAIEPELSEDTTTVGLAFRFDHGPPEGQMLKRFGAMEKVALRNEEPTLIRAIAVPAAKGAKATTVRALLVRATIVDVYGVRPPPPPPPKPHPHQP